MTDEKSPEASKPETEVSDKAKRRRFTAAYKQRILEEAASCSERGSLGALLRREGLYSSQLANWRKAARTSGMEGLNRKRGRKAIPVNPLEKQVTAQQRQIEKLIRRAERAEAIIEVQKKVSQLLGIALPTPEEGED